MLALGASALVTLIAQAGSAAPSTCPDAAAVWRAARPLLRDPAMQADPLVTVEDRGAEYAVTVKGRGPVSASTRVLRDDARDCEVRTRSAAVFVALVLRADELSRPTPVAPRWSFDVGTAGGALLGLGGDRARASLGATASLRAELRRGRWGGELGLGFSPERTLRYDAEVVSAWLAPAQIGIVHRRGGDRWSGALHMDAVLMVVRGTLTSAPLAPTSLGAQLGGGPGLEVARRLSPSWSVWARADGWWFPRPTELLVDPQGRFGRVSPVWLALALGVTATVP